MPRGTSQLPTSSSRKMHKQTCTLPSTEPADTSASRTIPLEDFASTPRSPAGVACLHPCPRPSSCLTPGLRARYGWPRHALMASSACPGGVSRLQCPGPIVAPDAWADQRQLFLAGRCPAKDQRLPALTARRRASSTYPAADEDARARGMRAAEHALVAPPSPAPVRFRRGPPGRSAAAVGIRWIRRAVPVAAGSRRRGVRGRASGAPPGDLLAIGPGAGFSLPRRPLPPVGATRAIRSAPGRAGIHRA